MRRLNHASVQHKSFVHVTLGLKQGNHYPYSLTVFADYIILVTVNTISLCTGSTFSIVSYGGGCDSLIDHILVQEMCIDLVMSSK